MAEKRPRKRKMNKTPRLIMVELRQYIDLESVVEGFTDDVNRIVEERRELENVRHQLTSELAALTALVNRAESLAGLLAEQMEKRSAAARRANQTRRQPPSGAVPEDAFAADMRDAARSAREAP